MQRASQPASLGRAPNVCHYAPCCVVPASKAVLHEGVKAVSRHKGDVDVPEARVAVRVPTRTTVFGGHLVYAT